jgi:hypothetical protein
MQEGVPLGIGLLVREPQADTVRQFASRVYYLAGLYALLFVASIAGLVLIVQWARLFVTLTQRSNVETLVLLFLVAFYFYFVLISWRGAVGACNLLFHASLAVIKGRDYVEGLKSRRLRQPPEQHSAALNLLLERDDGAHGSFELAVADDAGELGVLEIDGARVTYQANYSGSSSEVFIFLVHQVNRSCGLLTAGGWTSSSGARSTTRSSSSTSPWSSSRVTCPERSVSRRGPG